jgi:two-component system, chemotaxis family, CheB/CheR fusion protein
MGAVAVPRARVGLRLDLRAAVHKALNTHQTVIQRNVVVGTVGGLQSVNLIARPLRSEGSAETLCMIVFQDVGALQVENDREPHTGIDDPATSTLHQLESELRAAKERLQTTTEELESSNEELKSSNEKLSSINEELQTVNAELKARVDELSHAISDIANLPENTQIATLFLDRQLTVQSFTPSAMDCFTRSKAMSAGPSRMSAHASAPEPSRRMRPAYCGP